MAKIGKGPFKGLHRNHYRTIMMDAPWRFVAGKSTRTAPYPTMTREELLALPVADLAAPAACLFMWTSGPFLKQSMDLGERYGFTFVTIVFNWVKLWPREGNRLFVYWQDVAALTAGDHTADGTGYWTRAGSEMVLLFTRGDVDWSPGNPLSDRARDVSQVVISERREHSRKPETVQDGIEKISVGPFVELFGRRHRPGWNVWGNQSDKFAPLSESTSESVAAK